MTDKKQVEGYRPRQRLAAITFALSVVVVSTAGIVALRMNTNTRSTVRIRIDQVVFPPFNDWKNFAVYKCTVIDKQSRIAGSELNMVAPRTGREAQHAYSPVNYERMLEIGGEYVVVVSKTLPEGWETIGADFSDPRIGLTALLSVSKATKNESGKEEPKRTGRKDQ
jgi:hypothetical protein